MSFTHYYYQTRAFFCVIFLTTFITGCATQVVESPSPITRSAIPFSEFERVILFDAMIKEEYSNHSANKKAARKINEVLANQLRMHFANVEIQSNSDAQKNINVEEAKSVLLVKPYIKQVKFIGGGARFMVGAMAGSSVVVMDVAFVDAFDDNQLSNPGFKRVSSAWADTGFGRADNRMLSDIATDVAQYVSANR